MLSDTKIHQIELLLTLDYLLHHTDEKHPATQLDICRHATNFGLTYNGGKAGDSVKRQRIAACLEFLDEISDKFTDKLPFVLEKTNSGKYYVEERHGLNDNQVAKLLAAIKNDRYTKDEDVGLLLDRVLDAFSTSPSNRKIICGEYENMIRTSSKYDKKTSRKINLLEKAYREGKMIKVSKKSIGRGGVSHRLFWHRVYLMKEYNRTLYVFLVEISEINPCAEERPIFRHFVFDKVENIEISEGPEKEVLLDDFDDERDLNKMFLEKNPLYARKYGSLDGFIEKSKMPFSLLTMPVSFYFDLRYLEKIKRSYEEFFSDKFIYQEGAVGEREVLSAIRHHNCTPLGSPIDTISKTHSSMAGAQDLANGIRRSGYVKTYLNMKAFEAWMLSNMVNDRTISDAIWVLRPNSFYRRMMNFYANQMIKVGMRYFSKNGMKAALADNHLKIIGTAESEKIVNKYLNGGEMQGKCENENQEGDDKRGNENQKPQ